MPVPHRALQFCLALAIGAILLGLPSPARAANEGDISFGYTRTGSDIFYPHTPGLNGWDMDGQIRWKPFIGVEGDVDRYGIGANAVVPHTTSVLFGPKLSVGAAGFKFFGHFLFGGEHSSNSGAQPTPISGGAFAYTLGAGADIPIVPFFAWRVQLDRISAPNQTPSNATHARFVTGIVFRF